MTNPSDSQLFFRLAQQTADTLKIFCEIEEGQFGTSEELSEIQGIIDVPMLDSVLLHAIDEVEASLRLAKILAQKHGLERLHDRLNAIGEEK